MRICNTGNGGALNNNNANNANGVAPIGGTASFEYRKGKQSTFFKEFTSYFLKGVKQAADDGVLWDSPSISRSILLWIKIILIRQCLTAGYGVVLTDAAETSDGKILSLVMSYTRRRTRIRFLKK